MKPTTKPRTSTQLAALKRAVRAEIATLRVAEVTDLHRRNPCLNGSTLQAAHNAIAGWIY